ncbi:MAG: hypothetical protein DWC02_05215 [Candidatus Poseidoniales archaeon]|nr:MAG: hypothetical protein DWC02_05215 [Candidatus Poseidoniales archaeon]
MQVFGSIMSQVKVPISEPDIPLRGEHDSLEDKSIEVMFDGLKGRCFISSIPWRSEAIIVVFDEEHPRFGKEFGTKYYFIDTPGVLSYGHDGETIEIYSLK